MKEFNLSTISEIRQQASIVEIISEYVILKNSGRDYRGLCPFHNEKTPSFHVNLEKGIFKCFGCGVGGDVFAFLQKVLGKTFGEVLRDLGARYGISIEQSNQAYTDTAIHYKICQSAMTYYQELLLNPKSGQVANEYLKTRDINHDSCQKFNLGYAPNSYDGLITYLTKYIHVSVLDIEKAGLARQKDGKYYDLFRNRLIIPIINEFGKTIAFGGRDLGTSPVKYLNSPETPIFTKGNNLFGLNLAKEKISYADYVILVEGYLDVILAHQNGFSNTVASLGTALTPRQAKMLFKFTHSRKVYLAFDNDQAGIAAINRGIEIINELVEGIGCDLKILNLPTGKDMADFFLHCDQDLPLKQSKIQQLELALESAPNYLDFGLNLAIKDIDYHNSNGKVQAAQRLIPILAKIKSVIARSEFIKIWANKLLINENDLSQEVRDYQRQSGINQPSSHKIQAITIAKPNLQHSNKKGFYRQAEIVILAYFFTSQDDLVYMKSLLINEIFISMESKIIKQLIDENVTQSKSVDELFALVLDASSRNDVNLKNEVVNVWYKAQEIISQNADMSIMVLDSLKKLIKEQIMQELPKLLLELNNQENSAKIQSIISNLKKIEANELMKANDVNNLLEIYRKIKDMLSFNNQLERLK